jgi:hypothetical protein
MLGLLWWVVLARAALQCLLRQHPSAAPCLTLAADWALVMCPLPCPAVPLAPPPPSHTYNYQGDAVPHLLGGGGED